MFEMTHIESFWCAFSPYQVFTELCPHSEWTQSLCSLFSRVAYPCAYLSGELACTLPANTRTVRYKTTLVSSYGFRGVRRRAAPGVWQRAGAVRTATGEAGGR